MTNLGFCVSEKDFHNRRCYLFAPENGPKKTRRHGTSGFMKSETSVQRGSGCAAEHFGHRDRVGGNFLLL